MGGSGEGGHNALAGFLYQLLGSASLAAEVLGDPPDLDDEEWAVTFTLETHGQDAETTKKTAGGTRTRQLIQFKYSGNPEKYPIGNDDLIEILEAFRQSIRQANRAGEMSASYLLVTNRGFTPAAAKLIEAGKTDKPCEKLDAVEEKVDGKVRNKGRTRSKNAEYRAILKAWDHRAIDETDCRESIARRARAFGLLDDELPNAVDRLVSAFFQKGASTSNRRVTAAELDEKLTDFRNPRRLTDRDIRSMILQEIAAKREQLQAPRAMLLRPYLVENPVLLSRALVVVCGAGGTGKTVTACQILEQRITTCDEAPPPFVALSTAEELRGSWIAEIVSEWRNTRRADHQREAIDRAIDRLKVSSPGNPPVLVLALDGLDEVPPGRDRHAVQHLLRAFHKEDNKCRIDGGVPSSVLIVTCRDPNEVYSEWIFGGGWRAEIDGDNLLRVDEFSYQELCQLACDTLQTSAAERIAYTASLHGRLDASVRTGNSLHAVDSDFGQRTRLAHSLSVASMVGARLLDLGHQMEPSLRPANDEMFTALKHPSLWRCFAEHLTGEEQSRVLDGDSSAVSRLCQEYIRWLCWKAEHRKYSVPQDMALAILQAVAAGFEDATRTGTVEKDWIAPARSASGDSLVLANRMFRESEAMGLVRRLGKDSWKWRHTFVCEYLTNAAI